MKEELYRHLFKVTFLAENGIYEAGIVDRLKEHFEITKVIGEEEFIWEIKSKPGQK